MKMDQTSKRVTAFPPTRPFMAADFKDTKPSAPQNPQPATKTQQQQPDSLSSKVKKQMAGHEKCQKHKAYKVAFDAETNTLMCNQCLFEQQMSTNHEVKSESPLEFNQSHMFTALMTRELKTKYDGLYKQYKDGLCDVAEIDHVNVRDLLLEQAKGFFAQMRSKVRTVKHEVNMKVQNSQALIKLEKLIEANGEYFGENAGAMLEKEKAAFDQKLNKGRYASVVKNQAFYKEVIGTLEQADQHMKTTIQEATDLLERVVQVNPEVDATAKQLTEKIITESMNFDLAEGQAGDAESAAMAQGLQMDEEMVEVPPAECSSMFSVCLPQNSYYFQNVRHIENPYAVIKRGKTFQLYEHGKNGLKQVGTTDRYHVKIALLPGKSQLIVVGGSEDAECTRLSDRVQLISKDGKVSERKPISQPRAKFGLAIGELRSEANAQFAKSFVYAFGGVDMTGKSLKVCEKYNVKADIWQWMPELNIARQNATGLTIGDSLYVFGGTDGCSTIERLNIKLNMQRTGDKFELLDVRLPHACSDIGLIPCLSPQEVILVGGFGLDGRSVKNVLKFSARASGKAEGSQDAVEHQIDEIEADGMRADFFNTNSVVTMDAQVEACMVFGAQFKHKFTGSTFSGSQPI